MQCSLDTNCPHVKCAARRCAPMASSPRINTQLGARQTLELRRKARLPVHRPSACSGDLIAGDGTKNGLSRSEQKTLSTTQNNRLTGKAPYKSSANLTSSPWRASSCCSFMPRAAQAERDQSLGLLSFKPSRRIARSANSHDASHCETSNRRLD